MKKIIALVILAFTLPALAAWSFGFDGEFLHRHQVSFMGYEQGQCTQDGGSWDEGACLFEENDSIVVTKNGSDFFVRVSTIGNNAHTCEFEGAAKQTTTNTLLASAASDSFEPVTCELTLTYDNEGNVSVAAGDFSKCSYFCGANAGLDIEKAIRK